MSIGEALFVCGFTDVSANFERLGFLAVAVDDQVEFSDASSGRREPEKGHKEVEFVEKKRKVVGREEGYRLQRGVGASGVWPSDYEKSKGEGEEGMEGRRGGVGDEAPSTTPASCSLAVWAEGDEQQILGHVDPALRCVVVPDQGAQRNSPVLPCLRS